MPKRTQYELEVITMVRLVEGPSWTADFHLVDPVKLAETSNISEATLVTVRARMRHTVALWFSAPSDRQRYRLVGQNLLEMAHEAKGSTALEERATSQGTPQFFYCARCGERLGRQSCPRCEISYRLSQSEGAEFVSSVAPPVIPAKVAVYAEEHGGTRFRHFALRPRQP